MDHTQKTYRISWTLPLKCLRHTLNIKWQTYTPDTTVLEKAEYSNIECFIVLNTLRWAGDFVHMKETRIPKQLFYWELVNGKFPRHKLKNRFKHFLKYNFKELDSDNKNWEESALYCSEWRKAVKDGCSLL